MTEESAWLIEISHHGAPLWWSRVDNEDDGVCGWSSDSLKAIRFARSQDAQAIIDSYGWNTAKPSDHLWLDNEHRWKWFEKFQFTSCEDCGIVQRKDGKNGPCRGRVSVGLRAPSPELTQLAKAAREILARRKHTIDFYARNGPQWTSPAGMEYQSAPDVINAACEDVECLSAALASFKEVE